MDKRIRVLYLVSTLKRCGPTNQLFNIVSNLDSEKFAVKILTLSPETKDSMKQRFIESGLDVGSLELGRLEGLLRGWTSLLQQINLFSPDIVHSQGIRSDTYSARLRKKGYRVLSTIRCMPFEDYPAKYGRLKGGLMAKRHLKALTNIDVVVSVSKSLNSALSRVGLDTKTVRNGCDLSKYTPVTTEQKQQLRKELGLDPDKIIIVSVGHLSQIKDPVTVVKSFMALKAKDRYILLMVGDGELRAECEQEANGNDGVIFVGRVSNVNEYLQASDVFVSSSLSEGLPNTVLESLSCGTPTILSGIYQHREVLEGYWDLYPFFNTGDFIALSEIIEGLTLDKLDKLPTRNIVEENFDSIQTSSNYQHIYKSLCQKAE